MYWVQSSYKTLWLYYIMLDPRVEFKKKILKVRKKYILRKQLKKWIFCQ